MERRKSTARNKPQQTDATNYATYGYVDAICHGRITPTSTGHRIPDQKSPFIRTTNSSHNDRSLGKVVDHGGRGFLHPQHIGGITGSSLFRSTKNVSLLRTSRTTSTRHDNA